MATKQDWFHQVENERLSANDVSKTNDRKKIRITCRKENGTIYKTTETFEERQCTVLPIVAERKKWKKFGDATNDPPGINSTTTKVGDEFKMDFVSCIDDSTLLDFVTKTLGIQCRRCKGGHLSVKCPYKDHLQEIIEQPVQKTSKITTTTPLINDSSSNQNNGESSIRKYIPPGKRSSASSTNCIRKEDDATIRVSNLPEETQEQDLHDLFDRYGRITRIYLAKDKITNISKGYAFLTFNEKRDAQIAMNCVNGFGYGYLILKIEWAANIKSQN